MGVQREQLHQCVLRCAVHILPVHVRAWMCVYTYMRVRAYVCIGVCVCVCVQWRQFTATGESKVFCRLCGVGQRTDSPVLTYWMHEHYTCNNYWLRSSPAHFCGCWLPVVVKINHWECKIGLVNVGPLSVNFIYAIHREVSLNAACPFIDMRLVFIVSLAFQNYLSKNVYFFYIIGIGIEIYHCRFSFNESHLKMSL